MSINEKVGINFLLKCLNLTYVIFILSDFIHIGFHRNKQTIMKQTITTKLFASATILLLIMGFVNSKKWFSLESKEYNFKIEFPAEPTANPQIVNSEIGELKLNMFIYESPEKGNDDNLVYLVNCTEYPDSVINSDFSEILPAFFRNSRPPARSWLLIPTAS